MEREINITRAQDTDDYDVYTVTVDDKMDCVITIRYTSTGSDAEFVWFDNRGDEDYTTKISLESRSLGEALRYYFKGYDK